jgi:D-proline reductase (dithiol) PrdB
VGLIAREIEAAGIPTLSLTGAWDITRAVLPPRAVYIHHPLGNQGGAPGDAEGQREIMRRALEVGVAIEQPGEIVRLPFSWDDPGWESRAYTPEHTQVGPDGKPLRD